MANFIHGYNLEVDTLIPPTNGDEISVQIPPVRATHANESVLDENGRTYPGYRLNTYFLPNDAAEQARLDFQHEIYLLITGDRLGTAPVEAPRHCLDAATGTGIWAVQYAQKNPNCQVVGSDLSLIQRERLSLNCRFIQHDLENDAWQFEQQFDYIHFRYVVTCFDDMPAIIKKAYDVLRPGGWIEFFDPVPVAVPLDDTLHGTAVEEWCRLLVKGATAAGRDILKPAKYAKWCEEIGFINVKEKRFPLPSNGMWPKDPFIKKIGQYCTKNHTGLVDSLTKFISLAGLSMEAKASLEARVKKEIRDPRIHYYKDVYMVYAQKPLDAREVGRDV